jgi:metal-sulfur cluster biosynthetic enzyme
MDRMSQDIEEAMFVRQLPFAITQQLQPSWTTEWISEEGRKKNGSLRHCAAGFRVGR